MQPSSLLSYYPNFGILDEIVSYGPYKQINLYIDLKNNMQSTYMEHAIVNIVESSLRSRMYDTSVFSSLISFLAFHKRYSLNREIKMKYFIFFESGQSYYHKNISKQYKVSRRIDDLYGLDHEKRELFFKVLNANYNMIENACNKIPDMKVFRLQNLEADFIPYYLIRNKLVETDPSVGHVVYSNDHDLMQCVQENVYVYQKVGSKIKRIMKQGEVMKKEMGKPNTIPDEYLPLALAIIGDPGDDVYGIKGIGPASFIKAFDKLKKIIGSMEALYDNVMNGNPIFDLSKCSIPNKIMKQIIDFEENQGGITRNMKLVSFEILSRIMDDPPTIELLNRRKHIEKILETESLTSLDPLKDALTRTRVELESSALEILFHNTGG